VVSCVVEKDVIMNGFAAKTIGWLALLVGVTGLLAVVTLLLFFAGLAGNLRSLAFMGPLNDMLNASAGILSALLAAALHPALRRLAPRLSLPLLISVWTGALAHTYGSWLIITGRSDVELSSYYYFVGSGLIGVWLWGLNRVAAREAMLPRNLIRLGMIAAGFMIVGLLGLYGILSGSDGDDFPPLVLAAGISFVGMGILYPIWCLRLWRWIGSRQHDPLTLAQG
jgi:hypothetical protein